MDYTRGLIRYGMNERMVILTGRGVELWARPLPINASITVDARMFFDCILKKLRLECGIVDCVKVFYSKSDES